MKNIVSVCFALTVLAAIPATAHDPKEHREVAEPPNCEALAEMRQSKRDSKDPVFRALKKKCEEALHAESEKPPPTDGRAEEDGHEN